MAFVPFTKDDRPTMQAFNEKFQQIYGEASGKARIVAGSYTGTGVYGSANPNRLTFDGKPLFVAIQAPNGAGFARIIAPYGAPAVAVLENTTSYYAFLTWGDNFLTWFGNSNYPDHQLNTNGYRYYYAAVIETNESEVIQ